MRNNEGMTLIELMVVITVIGVLVIALGFNYSNWIGGYRIEIQTKEFYVDVMNARAKAMQRNRAHFVVIAADNYRIFEDTNENVDTVPGPEAGVDQPMTGFSRKQLQYSALSGTGTLTVSARGLVSPVPTTVRFDIVGNNPDFDCVTLLDEISINMGLWTQPGGPCVVK